MKSIHEWFTHNVGSQVTIRILAPGGTPEGALRAEKGVLAEAGVDYVSLRRTDRSEVLIPLHAIASWSPGA